MAARRDRLPHLDLGDQPACPRHPPHRAEQRVLADEGGRRAGRAPGRPVVQLHRLDGDARVQGGLEGGPAEVALGAAAPGAALGEHGDRLTGAQRPGDPGHRPGQCADTVPVDEQGAAAGGQPPRHRPLPDLRLGEHPGRTHGGEQRDVQPGDVVGDEQQPAVGRGAAVDPYPHSRGPDDPAAPAPDQPRGYPRAEGAEQDADDQQEQDGREPQHGQGYGRGPSRRVHARLRGAGRAGPPEGRHLGGVGPCARCAGGPGCGSGRRGDAHGLQGGGAHGRHVRHAGTRDRKCRR